MKKLTDKSVRNIFQIGICLFALTGIIGFNINSISYAKNNDENIIKINENNEVKKSNFQWLVSDTAIYCADESGQKLTGISYVDNGFRYFLEDGKLYTGWATISNKTFYFDPQQMGLMFAGEQFIDGVKYQFLPTGELITGWYKTEKGTFYRDAFGYDQYGFVTNSGKTYYVDTEKGLQLGQFELDHLYYTDSKGAILKGDCVLDGKQTHFDDNGNFIYGWLNDSNGMYYQDKNGVRATAGKSKIDGTEYYFDNNGYLMRNTVVGMYKADNNGKLTRLPISLDTLNAALDEILATTGKDIKTIGEYVRTHHAYKFITKMNSREEMAVYALNNRYISCYYYEALTGLLLERAGYEVITVKGKGFVYDDHYWSLVKTTRNGVEGYYHADSLKAKYIRTDAEMVADGFKWPHENYPPTP